MFFSSNDFIKPVTNTKYLDTKLNTNHLVHHYPHILHSIFLKQFLRSKYLNKKKRIKFPIYFKTLYTLIKFQILDINIYQYSKYLLNQLQKKPIISTHIPKFKNTQNLAPKVSNNFLFNSNLHQEEKCISEVLKCHSLEQNSLQFR